MLPLPRFALHRPATVAEATALVHRLGHGARLLAGGTDLLPNMKQGLVEPRALISLQRIESLQGVEADGARLTLGAMTPLEQVASDPRVREGAPALAEAAAAVGGPHHRRMGTLGGNLCLDTRCRYYNQTYFWRSALGFCLKKDGSVCHVVAGGQRCVAAASNDTAPALMALDATVTLESVRGTRVVPLHELYTADGISNTTREPDEILTRVTVPVASQRQSGFEKLRRRGAIDFPLLSIAARVDRDGDRLMGLELVVSALAARPRRVAGAAKLAAGAAPSPELCRAVAAAARKECRPLDNIEGDPGWRHDMVPVLVERLLSRLGVSGR